MWDADVSNEFFRQRQGYAMVWKTGMPGDGTIDPDSEEIRCDQAQRQTFFENLTTQDDHLMHIVGMKSTAKGKKFFVVKNSWGEIGPFKGYINVSEAYFAVNTVSLVIPKASIDRATLTKLGIK
jgi:bleomycin hydrolase